MRHGVNRHQMGKMLNGGRIFLIRRSEASLARREDDREDLLAEATALVRRAEFLMHDLAEPVVIGFRRNGAASIYFGQDEAFHFDTNGRLRRAFFDDQLYKADRGRLASLERRRTADEVQLRRHDLTDDETAQFLDHMQRRLTAVKQAVAAVEVRWLRAVPEGAVAQDMVVEWLGELPDRIEIAQSARVG